MSKIVGNLAGSYSPIGKTFILQDENGTEVTGVITEQEQVFTADVSDVIVGKTFASDEGVKVGENTKTYRVIHGAQCVLPNEPFSVPIQEYDCYDYTNFQAIVSLFNTSITDSAATDKVVLYDAIYNVNSANKIADITKNADAKSIDLNLTNNTENIYIIHFNAYREEY